MTEIFLHPTEYRFHFGEKEINQYITECEAESIFPSQEGFDDWAKQQIAYETDSGTEVTSYTKLKFSTYYKFTFLDLH